MCVWQKFAIFTKTLIVKGMFLQEASPQHQCVIASILANFQEEEKEKEEEEEEGEGGWEKVISPGEEEIQWPNGW